MSPQGTTRIDNRWRNAGIVTDMSAPTLPPSLLVTRRFAPTVRARLAARFALTTHDDEAAMGREALLRAAAGVSGAMVTPNDRIDSEFFDAAGPSLRIVATLSVGVDHIDCDEAARRGIVIAHTPDVLTRATAEIAIAIMLSLVRRVTEGDRLIRKGIAWELSPNFMLGTSLEGLQFGCVGFGRIGREASRLAAAFGMRAVHCSRRPTGEAGERSFDEVISTSDVVSLHCPLTPETHHLVNASVLDAMKPSSVLINTCRGKVVDERALADALRRGVIGGAGLDVFEDEPSVDPGLIMCDNAVLVPHLGSATHRTREAMGMRCVDALVAVLYNEGTATNILNVTSD